MNLLTSLKTLGRHLLEIQLTVQPAPLSVVFWSPLQFQICLFSRDVSETGDVDPVYGDGTLELTGRYAGKWLETKFSLPLPPPLQATALAGWTQQISYCSFSTWIQGSVWDFLSTTRMEWLGRSFFTNLLLESNFHIWVLWWEIKVPH